MENIGHETKSGGWRRYGAEIAFYAHIKEDVLGDAEKAGISPKQSLRLQLGIEEIAVNIMSYAYDAPGWLWVRTASDGASFRVEFADHGRPFDPLAAPPKHGEVPTAEQDEGGYGIFLVKKNFASVEYRYEEMFGHMANHLLMELPLS